MFRLFSVYHVGRISLSDFKKIAGYKPGNKDDTDNDSERCRVNLAVERGTPCTVYVDPGKESYDRYRQKSQGIRSECARQISVEKGVKHTLATAADTLQTCDPMEKALGHEAGSKRVGKIIEYGSGHKHRGHNPSQP